MNERTNDDIIMIVSYVHEYYGRPLLRNLEHLYHNNDVDGSN